MTVMSLRTIHILYYTIEISALIFNIKYSHFDITYYICIHIFVTVRFMYTQLVLILHIIFTYED